MYLVEIVLPEQSESEASINLDKKERDSDTNIEIESQTVIVAEVIGFYSPHTGYSRYSINPKCLPFANFVDDFTRVTLIKEVKNNTTTFKLAVSFEVEDHDGEIWEKDRLLQVTSAREVKNFPPL
jgi:hypothetical protein